MRQRKGIAMYWVYALVSLGFISVLYIIMSYPLMGIMLPMFQSGGNLYVNNTNVQNVYSIINSVWSAWPIVMIVGALLYVIAASQKKEYEQYQ